MPGGASAAAIASRVTPVFEAVVAVSSSPCPCDAVRASAAGACAAPGTRVAVRRQATAAPPPIRTDAATTAVTSCASCVFLPVSGSFAFDEDHAARSELKPPLKAPEGRFSFGLAP